VSNVEFGLRRKSRFSYHCNRCNRCCHNKRIPITPYDIVRLARKLEISTGEFIERFTDEGIRLKVRMEDANAACVFLGPSGCTVHSDRPAPCRIYPLSWATLYTGEDVFGFMEPDPETEGVYGEDGTVGEFADAQGLADYGRTSILYQRLFEEIAERFESTEESLAGYERAEGEPHLLDVDAVVAAHCVKHALPAPTGAEETVELHVAALREWIAEME